VYPVGWDATGLAAGDLGLGIDAADLVVTARSAEATDSPGAVFALYQEEDNPGLTTDSFLAQVPGPRGPSIGPILDGQPGIVVANAGAAAPSISVYSPVGGSHAEYPVHAVGVAWETVVGDFIGGGTGVAVAVRSESGSNAVSVFPAAGATLGARADVLTGDRFATSSLAIGSLTADSTQLVVGNAGLLSRTAGQSVSPSTQVITWNGSGFDIALPRWAGGTELAGGSPSLAVVDLGPVGRSRHPASAIEGAHVSTETAGFERHAECVDCHNVHAATAEPADDPPYAYGAVRGTSGVDAFASTYEPVEQVVYEYEMCLKCHAKAEWGGSPRDIAAELDPALNQGFHSVIAPSPYAQNNADTFVSGWTVDSQMYCVSCHGNAGAGPNGPHVSSQAPLLNRPYIGALPSDNGVDGLLCYSCHKPTVYYDGTEDSPTPVAGSLFYDAETSTTGTLLHQKHVSDHGLSCEACHVSHGGTDHMIRDDIDWIHHPNNGSGCFTECHDYSTAHVYSRIPEYENPSALEVQFFNTYTGDLASIQAQDGNLLTVREDNGAPPVSRVQIDFYPVYFPLAVVPSSLEIYGYYDGGNQNHLVQVEAYNWTTLTWDALGTLPKATTAGQYTYPIMAGAYLSNDDRVRVRIDHKDNGNQNHYLYLDRVWLRH
jgi:hypothetical protein